jgi:hypothetical protein
LAEKPKKKANTLQGKNYGVNFHYAISLHKQLLEAHSKKAKDGWERGLNDGCFFGVRF